MQWSKVYHHKVSFAKLVDAKKNYLKKKIKTKCPFFVQISKVLTSNSSNVEDVQVVWETCNKTI